MAANQELSSPLLPQVEEGEAAHSTTPVNGESNRTLGSEEPRFSIYSVFRNALTPDRSRSNAVVPIFLVTVLLSFSIGLTVGIVPEVLTDRYARLHGGYGVPDGDGLQPLQPCWRYNANTMPEACERGAGDAQTGSAYGMFVQNLLTFFFNAMIGSYSDTHGRRGPLLMSIFLNTLMPASLVALELCENLNPIWFYASNAATGVVYYPSIVFAMLSDDCPEEHRAGRFATNMGGFFGGFALAPALATRMSHIVASWWSLGLAAAALVFSVLFLPETLAGTSGHGADAFHVVMSGDDSEETANSSYRDGYRHHQHQQHDEDFRTNPSSALPREDDSVLSSFERTDNRTDAVPSLQSMLCSCWKASMALLLRPLREMTILTRDSILVLVALASFLSAAVYSTDASLVLFYIEDQLNVREDDIARMFFCMGLLGAILQGIGLQPMVSLLGETGLLLASFISGTIHNMLYGIATNKKEITLALSLSQVTKLSYPLLSSLASRQVGMDEQGRVQGALLALNALAGAVGPVSMNWVYTNTKSGTHKYLGPGTMFNLMSGLYLLGTAVVCWIHRLSPVATDAGNSNNCGDSSSDNNSCSDNASTTVETTGRSDSLGTPLSNEVGEI